MRVHYVWFVFDCFGFAILSFMCGRLLNLSGLGFCFGLVSGLCLGSAGGVPQLLLCGLLGLLELLWVGILVAHSFVFCG